MPMHLVLETHMFLDTVLNNSTCFDFYIRLHLFVSNACVCVGVPGYSS